MLCSWEWSGGPRPAPCKLPVHWFFSLPRGCNGPSSSLMNNSDRKLAEVPFTLHRGPSPAPTPQEYWLSPSSAPASSSQLTPLRRACPCFHGNLEPRTISRAMLFSQTKPPRATPTTGKTSVEDQPSSERGGSKSLREQGQAMAGAREVDFRELS